MIRRALGMLKLIGDGRRIFFALFKSGDGDRFLLFWWEEEVEDEVDLVMVTELVDAGAGAGGM